MVFQVTGIFLIESHEYLDSVEIPERAHLMVRAERKLKSPVRISVSLVSTILSKEITRVNEN